MRNRWLTILVLLALVFSFSGLAGTVHHALAHPSAGQGSADDQLSLSDAGHDAHRGLLHWSYQCWVTQTLAGLTGPVLDSPSTVGPADAARKCAAPADNGPTPTPFDSTPPVRGPPAA